MSLRYRSSAYYNTASSLWPCDINYLKAYRYSTNMTVGEPCVRPESANYHKSGEHLACLFI